MKDNTEVGHCVGEVALRVGGVGEKELSADAKMSERLVEPVIS